MTNASEDCIRLVGDKVILRPWKSQDKQSLIENGNNYKIAINLRNQFPYPYTEQKADEWLNFVTSLTCTERLYLAIEVDEKAVGGIAISFGNDVHNCTAELGYWLGESYWNRGIMTEAVVLLRKYAFEKFPHLQRLYAEPFSSNLASTKVLEKAQFQFEGRLRKSVINRDGIVLDQLLYSFVRE
ncbi:unnamed protein product [Adineta ricciae]|uniref:N-acetyltransferase domain-containing protein n=1 Tax=Adineta ricciae TaxID=249248 RepID=A0A814T9E6_ADIRI|nr:unnamed protein product [Adineta ricciae]CAF1317198.1 unnamed protein product [Adineta ricciae]